MVYPAELYDLWEYILYAGPVRPRGKVVYSNFMQIFAKFVEDNRKELEERNGWLLIN